MTAINIFRTIRNTTRRIEPFHSQFLGEALNHNQKRDRVLFDGVWKLCAPDDWAPPRHARVSNEFRLDNSRRIDILIEDYDTGRVLGIEIKTSHGSARLGQLEDYLQDLRSKGYDDAEIAVAYLTPFNRSRAEQIVKSKERLPIATGVLSTIEIFESFHRIFEKSRHVSWLDVADIEWNAGGESWSQHRCFVRDEIATPKLFKSSQIRNRSLDAFFSNEAVTAFWESLLPLEGVVAVENGVKIEVEEFTADPISLTHALKFLITDAEFVVSRSRSDRFNQNLRKRFLNSHHCAFHKVLFDLSERFEHVWLQGERDYGLRVAHKDHAGGVSLVTSQDVDSLIVGRRR